MENNLGLGELPSYGTYDFLLDTFAQNLLEWTGGLYGCGLENFDISKNTILAPVHRHPFFDTVAVIKSVQAAVKYNQPESQSTPHIHFVSKKENFNNIVLGKFLRSVGIFGIDRESKTPIWKQEETINHIMDIFDQKDEDGNKGILAIYPEGTRLSGNTINRKDIKIGAVATGLTVSTLSAKNLFNQAMTHSQERLNESEENAIVQQVIDETETQIIPIGISGAEQPFSRRPICVAFGKPIIVQSMPFEIFNDMRIIDFVKACKPYTDQLHENLQAAQDVASKMESSHKKHWLRNITNLIPITYPNDRPKKATLQ